MAPRPIPLLVRAIGPSPPKQATVDVTLEGAESTRALLATVIAPSSAREVVRVERPIVRQHRDPFGDRLGDDHAVERITVMER